MLSAIRRPVAWATPRQLGSPRAGAVREPPLPCCRSEWQGEAETLVIPCDHHRSRQACPPQIV